MSHTFNISVLPSLPPRMPPSLPPTPPKLPNDSPLPRQSSIDRPSKQEEGRGEVRTKYQKYFERNYGAGKFTRMKSSGGLLNKRIHGVEGDMKRFQKDRSGVGKNLSNKDIKAISGRIGETLKRLPGRIISRGTEHIPAMEQRRLRGKLYSDMKRGIIQKNDLIDAERIIKDIEI